MVPADARSLLTRKVGVSGRISSATTRRVHERKAPTYASSRQFVRVPSHVVSAPQLQPLLMSVHAVSWVALSCEARTKVVSERGGEWEGGEWEGK